MSSSVRLDTIFFPPLRIPHSGGECFPARRLLQDPVVRVQTRGRERSPDRDSELLRRLVQNHAMRGDVVLYFQRKIQRRAVGLAFLADADDGHWLAVRAGLAVEAVSQARQPLAA